jgi:exonuclease SbcC
VEGFKSYAGEQTLTFDGRSLFGIVGPTGAGKSTVLEAMMYALYGRTHREARDTRDLIRIGADSARVRFAFEVATGAWEVTRVLRRKGASEAVLRRPGSQNPEVAGQTAVSARIEELVGLDFAAFCSSVVLPQGEFDRFLMATPKERSRILKGIFRLERVDAIRERAKKRASALGEEASERRGELRALPADPGRLEELRRSEQQARERAEDIRGELPGVTAAEATIAQQQVRLADLGHRAEAIDRALAKVPSASDLDGLAAVEQEWAHALEAAQATAALARTAYEEAALALEAAQRETGGPDLIRRARERNAVRRRLEEQLQSTESERRALEKEAEAAAEEVRQRGAEAAADAEAARGAEARLRELEREHAAHVLRVGLAPGSACPVCAQTVAVVPAAEPPGTLEEAEGRLAVARATAEGSAARHQGASDTLVKATERQRAAGEAAERARREIADALADLGALLGAQLGRTGYPADPTAEIARREGLLESAVAAETEARRSAAAAEAAAARAAAEAERDAKRRRVVAAGLTELSGALGFEPPDIEGGVAELRRATGAAAEAGARLRAEVGQARAEVDAEVRQAGEVVAGFRTRFGLQLQTSAAEALAETMKLVGSVQGEIRAVEQAIERAAELERAIAGIEADRALFDRLALDMTDHKFTAYLLDAERRLLARLGSEKLFELTAGRYRFDDEGTFEIVEARSDGKRAAGTLSGGETFLASLALALALAEAVSQTGGRLGCFFLDEGFGSLDSESLELALDGIESLASPGRLIGLISHVHHLQARLEDLIMLDKAPDGSTVVVQSEGALSYPAALI